MLLFDTLYQGSANLYIYLFQFKEKIILDSLNIQGLKSSAFRLIFNR